MTKPVRKAITQPVTGPKTTTNTLGIAVESKPTQYDVGDMVAVTKEIWEAANVTKVTLNNWLRNYTVRGERLGRKVGGRWRINLKLLSLVLKGEAKIEKISK